MPQEVVVVAVLKAKPGEEAVVERQLRGFVAPTHREQGCIRYALTRALDDPGRFVFVERWASRDALDEHMRAPHLRPFADLAAARLAEPPHVLLLEALPEGDPDKGAV